MNEFDILKANMAAKTTQTIAEFGIPDKVILSEDVKFWHITGVAVPHVSKFERVSWPDIVPVFSGGAVIGAARLFPKGKDIVATVTLPYETPERLDSENGKDFALYPDLHHSVRLDSDPYNPDMLMRVRALELIALAKYHNYPISTLEEEVEF